MKKLLCLFLLLNIVFVLSCKERVSPTSQAKFVRSGADQDNIFVTSLGTIEPKLRSSLTEQMSLQLEKFGLKIGKLEFLLSTVVRSNGVLTESVPTFLVSEIDIDLKIGSILPPNKVLLFECAFDDGIDDDSSQCDLKRGRDVVGKSSWGSSIYLTELCSLDVHGCKLGLAQDGDEKSAFKLSLQPR